MTVLSLPDAERRVGSAIAEGTLWACVVVSVMALLATAFVIDSFDYRHAWVSAHFAVMAQAFAENGIWVLGGVPVQNFPPLTSQPDAYVNWPPLYPMILSFVVSIFGTSETVIHLFAVGINLAIAGLLFLFIRDAAGRLGGAVAVVVFLNTPIIASFGHVALNVQLAMLFCLAALLCFARVTAGGARRSSSRRWMAPLGAVTMFLGVAASWEAFLVVPGLLFVAVVRRDFAAVRLAFIYGSVGAAAIVAVFGLYAHEHPGFFRLVVERVTLRAGLGSPAAVTADLLSPHLIQEHNTGQRVASPFPDYLMLLIVRWGLVGPMGLLAIPGVIMLALRGSSSGRRGVAYGLAGMASVYVLWAVLLRQHMEVHDYQTILLAPLAGLCAGVLVGRIADAAPAEKRRLLGVVLALTVAVGGLSARVGPSLVLMGAHDPANNQTIQFARAVGQLVEPDAIVVQTHNDMVPVYYMRRHAIRGVADETILQAYRKPIEALCLTCPIYVAVQNGDEPRFATLMQTSESRTIAQLGSLLVLRAAR